MPQFLSTAAPDSRFCGSCCRTLCACVTQVIFVWVLMGLCWSGCHGGDVSQHVCVCVWSGRCVLHMASQDTTKWQNWHDHLPRSTTYRTTHDAPACTHIYIFKGPVLYSTCSPPQTQKYSNLILHDMLGEMDAWSSVTSHKLCGVTRVNRLTDRQTWQNIQPSLGFVWHSVTSEPVHTHHLF